MKEYFSPQSTKDGTIHVRFKKGRKASFIASVFLTSVIISTAILSGCKDNHSSTDKPADSILDTLHSSVSDLGKTIDSSTKETRESVQQLAAQELEKLYKYEYKVVSFQASISDQEMEAQLAELGKDRWNCFHGETVNGSTRLICSRLPLSVLKLVPFIWKVF